MIILSIQIHYIMKNDHVLPFECQAEYLVNFCSLLDANIVLSFHSLTKFKRKLCRRFEQSREYVRVK